MMALRLLVMYYFSINQLILFIFDIKIQKPLTTQDTTPLIRSKPIPEDLH